MSDNHNKFLSALRGIEKLKKPLDSETLISSGEADSSSGQINLQEMTPEELAEYWNGEPLSKERD